MDRSTSRQTGHAINNSTFEDDSEIDKVVSHWTGLDWTCTIYEKACSKQE